MKGVLLHSGFSKLFIYSHHIYTWILHQLSTAAWSALSLKLVSRFWSSPYRSYACGSKSLQLRFKHNAFCASLRYFVQDSGITWLNCKFHIRNLHAISEQGAFVCLSSSWVSHEQNWFRNGEENQEDFIEYIMSEIDTETINNFINSYLNISE